MTDFITTNAYRETSTPSPSLAAAARVSPYRYLSHVQLQDDYKNEASDYLSNFYEDTELIKSDPTETYKLSVTKNDIKLPVSIKIMNRLSLSFDIEMYLIQEINILKDLDHPNIIQLIDCVIYPNSYSVIYEHFNGEDLGHRITNRKSYNELQARNWIQDIFSAVNFCHERNIIHR
jgi:serine/threonine protein kinase